MIRDRSKKRVYHETLICSKISTPIVCVNICNIEAHAIVFKTEVIVIKMQFLIKAIFEIERVETCHF